jgi:hypothetical protein
MLRSRWPCSQPYYHLLNVHYDQQVSQRQLGQLAMCSSEQPSAAVTPCPMLAACAAAAAQPTARKPVLQERRPPIAVLEC